MIDKHQGKYDALCQRNGNVKVYRDSNFDLVYDETKIAEGSFGSKTESAIKSWQKENGLKDDGVVGKNTWDKMFPIVIKEDVVIKPVTGLNIEKLKGHIPDVVIAQIPETAKKFNITTNLRLAHFLSQCAHESGNFKVVSENLNYSVDGLKSTFGKYFRSKMDSK